MPPLIPFADAAAQPQKVSTTLFGKAELFRRSDGIAEDVAPVCIFALRIPSSDGIARKINVLYAFPPSDVIRY